MMKDIDTLIEMVQDADTENDLIDIEGMVGIHALLKQEDWEMTRILLDRLDSGFAPLYVEMVKRWDEIVG